MTEEQVKTNEATAPESQEEMKEGLHMIIWTNTNNFLVDNNTMIPFVAQSRKHAEIVKKYWCSIHKALFKVDHSEKLKIVHMDDIDLEKVKYTDNRSKLVAPILDKIIPAKS